MKLELAIQRQDGPAAPETRRVEEFSMDVEPNEPLAAVLLRLPVAFESACRSDACGACALLVNGRVRMACRTLVREALPKRGPVVLAPLSKFPVVRDLIVDKSRLRRAQTRAGATLAGPAESAHETPRAMAEADRCVECGACVEACPETAGGAFVGAAALNEARVLLETAAGARAAASRLDALMAKGGVAGCGKAQSCVEVCPERIPLFDSILMLERETARHWLRTLLRR